MDRINYSAYMHDAMQGMIKNILRQVQENGLPGDHHFYITVDTRDPELEMAPWLKSNYPEDITLVIQHWFDNLEVKDNGFAITLNFGNAPEPMFIPYSALRTFADPSVEFGLRFEQHEYLDEDEDETPEDNVEQLTPKAADDTPQEEDDKSASHSADVVSLDRFR